MTTWKFDIVDLGHAGAASLSTKFKAFMIASLADTGARLLTHEGIVQSLRMAPRLALVTTWLESSRTGEDATTFRTFESKIPWFRACERSVFMTGTTQLNLITN
jgi:hypothetical protein